MAAYLTLARDFIVKTHVERFQREKNPEANVELLIDELLICCNQEIKDDRRLAQKLKALKQALVKCSHELPRNQTAIEEELRTVLLDLGFGAASIDEARSTYAWQQNRSFQYGNIISSPETQHKASQEPPEESRDERAFRLNEEGNKCFKAEDYKTALMYYEAVLSTPNISSDIFIKAASNQIAALLRWDGTTKEKMEKAAKDIQKAMRMDCNQGNNMCSNAKLFYRDGQASEWLGQLMPANIGN